MEKGENCSQVKGRINIDVCHPPTSNFTCFVITCTLIHSKFGYLSTRLGVEMESTARGKLSSNRSTRQYKHVLVCSTFGLYLKLDKSVRKFVLRNADSQNQNNTNLS